LNQEAFFASLTITSKGLFPKAAKPEVIGGAVHSRREFLSSLSGASAGIFFVGCGVVDSALATAQSCAMGKRRQVTIGGQRVLTIDVHTHVLVSEALDLLKTYKETESIRDQFASSRGPGYDLHIVDARLERMDREGIDVQVVGINPFWYWAERDLASQIVQIQNEAIAKLCASHPDRFVGLASVALQFPELAADQLEQGMKKLDMRGCLIGGSVNGEELSAPKFYPFWERAEQLQAFVFIHPQRFPEAESRLQGNGFLSNVIGQPLETTVTLSHLIFEGTLDRFPNLKICAAHGGGFLPSYSGRMDACLIAFPSACKPVKKEPSEYLKQLYFDSIVVTGEGLRHLVATAGVSQVLLGTDFPTDWNSKGVDHILGTSSLSDADKKAILGGNAAKLLRIDPQSGSRSIHGTKDQREAGK
jgi:aminocarboxymuconate-semialdehyde decarboxylase